MKIVDALSFLLVLWLVVYLRLLNHFVVLLFLQFLFDDLVLNLYATPDDFCRLLLGGALHSRSLLVILTPDLLLIGVIFFIPGRWLFLRVKPWSQSRFSFETERLGIIQFVGLLVGQFLGCEVTQPCFPLIVLLLDDVHVVHLGRIERTGLVGGIVILEYTGLADLQFTLRSFQIVDLGSGALQTALLDLQRVQLLRVERFLLEINEPVFGESDVLILVVSLVGFEAAYVMEIISVNILLRFLLFPLHTFIVDLDVFDMHRLIFLLIVVTRWWKGGCTKWTRWIIYFLQVSIHLIL